MLLAIYYAALVAVAVPLGNYISKKKEELERAEKAEKAKEELED